MTCGVPQGNILGLLLFNIYMLLAQITKHAIIIMQTSHKTFWEWTIAHHKMTSEIL